MKTITHKIASYETIELKLAALLLAEIVDSSFETALAGNSLKKKIKIIYPACYENDVREITAQFINRQARVDVYRYNQSLNRLRDALNEGK